MTRPGSSVGEDDDSPYLTAAWIVAVALFLFPITSPDVFWHLSAGRDILSRGAVPRADWLSWTRFGRPWLDFEWLGEVIYLLVHGAAGMPGLWLLKTGLFSAAAWAALRTARLARATGREQAGLLAALALGLMPSLDLRPENFSLVFFSLELWFLESRRLSGPRWSRLEEAALSAAFFSLWANLHAGFIYGLALAAAYAVGPLSFTKFSESAHLLGAAALGTALNPAGPRVYQVLSLHGRDLPLLRRHLVEWRPASLDNQFEWPFLAIMAVAAASGLQAWRRRAWAGAHLLALLPLALSALLVSRNSSYFCLACVPLLPSLLGRKGRASLSRLAPVLVAAAALFGALDAWPLSLKSPVWLRSQFPEGEAAFLKREAAALSGLKMFNPWGWGGYLGYELAPPYKVFMDGRYLFHDLLDPVEQAHAAPDGWQRFLDLNGIGLVLLQPSPQTFGGRPFYAVFMPEQRWAMIYWDKTGLVFVRRSSVPGTWLSSREFLYLKPGDLETLRARVLAVKGAPAAVADELARFERETGDAALAQSLRDWLARLPRPSAP